MKLTTVALVGLLATVRCPGTPKETPPRVVEDDDQQHDCWSLYTSLSACEPGVEQIDPLRDTRLGFDKRFYGQPQPAFVASVSGPSMVLEGPWDMPYTFTWFEPLDELFAVGDEVVLSGRGWDLVEGPRGSVAHANVYGFAMHDPGIVGTVGPDIGFFADCLGSRTSFVYGVSATLGDERVAVSQGERASIAGWELLHHGAASAPGYEEDCMVVEGYFHGAVSAWTINASQP